MDKENNVFDYVYWRGDIPFEHSPFNEIDSLVLSVMAFHDFDGIVPRLPGHLSVSFKRAMEDYDSGHDANDHLGALIPDTMTELTRLASKSRRFGSLQLTAFENTVDENECMQFSAVTVLLPYGRMFVAFRGTDDTIVGWREDLEMSLTRQVGAQKRAAEYLGAVYNIHRRPYYTGGHSKGGNLAAWAALTVSPDIQRKLIRAYNNDGPGFNQDMMNTPEYKRIAGRIKTVVPESSVIGMLLEHDEKCELIHSTSSFVLQHDPLTWAVDRDRFVYVHERTRVGKRADDALRRWIDGMCIEDRRLFIDNMFSILGSADAKTITDITRNKLKNLLSMIKTVRSMDGQTRDRMLLLLRGLIGAQSGEQ